MFGGKRLDRKVRVPRSQLPESCVRYMMARRQLAVSGLSDFNSGTLA